MLANQTEKSLKTGNNVIKFGLGLQIVFFLIFLLVATIFFLRVWRKPTAAATDPSVPWKRNMFALFAASKMILTRCCYRMAEYVQASNALKGTTIHGYAITHEWCFYVLDALLMALVMLIFAIRHPSEVNAVINGDGLAMRKVVLTRDVGAYRPGRNMYMPGYGASEPANGGYGNASGYGNSNGYGNGHPSIGAPTGVRKDGVNIDQGGPRQGVAYPVPARPRY